MRIIFGKLSCYENNLLKNYTVAQELTEIHISYHFIHLFQA
jgi:hypothetical protein